MNKGKSFKIMNHIINYINKKRDLYANKLIKWMISRKKEKVWLLKICMHIYSLLMIYNDYECKYKSENHHYIQRFILENFKIKNSEKSGKIYRYEKNGKIENISINKEAAVLKDFYSVPHIKTKVLSLMLEKRNYSFIERWGKIIIEDYIINSNELVPELDSFKASQLATYTAFQYVRTPAFKAQLKNFLLYLIEKERVNIDVFSNKNKRELFDIILNNKLQIERKSLVEFNIINKAENRDVESLIRNKLDNLNSVLNLACVMIGNHIAEAVYRKKLFVLSVNEPYFFILPDSGVMVYDFKKKEYFLWPYGWNFTGEAISIFFPISIDKCLVFTNFDLNIEDLRDSFIKMAIILAYHQKHKYIFSDRKDKHIQKNIDTFPLTNHFD